MNTYRITFVAGMGMAEKDVPADDYQVLGDFLEFYSEETGKVYTVQAKHVRSVERIQK